MTTQAKARRLLGQFEELVDDGATAVDIVVCGAEDDPGLHPLTRSQASLALAQALGEQGTGAFVLRVTTDGTVWRVPIHGA